MATNTLNTARTGPAPLNDRAPRTRLIPIYAPYLFLLPAFALLIAFRYFPAISAIYHSFTDWDGTSPANFVGLDQYTKLLNDEVFITSIRNILFYTLNRTLLTTVMAIVGAELVYNLRGMTSRAIWRVVFTLPLVIPTSVIFLVWRQVFAGRAGLINELLKAIGMASAVRPWLGQTDTALLALTVIGFPLISGFGFLVLLSGLQNMPTEVNDAALIDGCTRLRRVWSIDLPSIRGPIALLVILSVTAGLQEFAPMFIVTGGGGPINSTQSPGLYLYQQAFPLSKFGYSTAIGTVLMLMTLAFSVVILRIRYRRAVDVEV